MYVCIMLSSLKNLYFIFVKFISSQIIPYKLNYIFQKDLIFIENSTGLQQYFRNRVLTYHLAIIVTQLFGIFKTINL